MVYAVGILPLERSGYQSGKAQGGREFPVSEMVEDFGNNFYRKIWGFLVTEVRTKGFWRGGRGCVGDGRRLWAILACN
jgi:hypothetical protein